MLAQRISMDWHRLRRARERFAQVVSSDIQSVTKYVNKSVSELVSKCAERSGNVAPMSCFPFRIEIEVLMANSSE